MVKVRQAWSPPAQARRGICELSHRHKVQARGREGAWRAALTAHAVGPNGSISHSRCEIESEYPRMQGARREGTQGLAGAARTLMRDGC